MNPGKQDHGNLSNAETPSLRPIRRQLPPNHDLFEEGSIQREEAAFQQSEQGLQEGNQNQGLASNDSQSFESLHLFRCSLCNAALLSGHLLDLHVSEAHGSFFAAQAARRMKVFRCLVEGCPKAFTSIMDRRKHLINMHSFPSNYAFDRMHLCKKQGQQRPERPFQKAAPKPPKGTHVATAMQLDQGTGADTGLQDKHLQLHSAATKKQVRASRYSTPQTQEQMTISQAHPEEAQISGSTQMSAQGFPAEGGNTVKSSAKTARQSTSTLSADLPARHAAAAVKPDGSGMDVDSLADRLSKLQPPGHIDRGQPYIKIRGRRIALPQNSV